MRQRGLRYLLVSTSTVAFLIVGMLAGCGAASEQPLPGSVHVVVRGHQEIAPEETVVAVFLGTSPAVGLCLQAPVTWDTSLWEARLTLDGRPLTDVAAPPQVAMGPTVCFRAEVPSAFLPTPEENLRNARLSGILRDRFDGATFQLPEAPVRFIPDDATHKALQADVDEVLSTIGGEGDPWKIVERIDALQKQSREQGAHLLAVRLVLVSTYTLRRLGTEDSLAEVERRLDDLPDWLDHPSASAWATQAAYARASLALQNRKLQEAWEHLRHTEELQLRTANFNHLSTVLLQASIRAQVGTPREAALILRAALEDCGKWPCNEKMLPDLRSSLVWLIALDPLARDEELDIAEEALTEAQSAARGDASVVQQANHLLNSAALDSRQGKDPTKTHTEARKLLMSLPATERERDLEDWGQVIEGEWHLSQGRHATSLKHCRGLMAATEGRLGEAATWARGCIGRSLRASGDLEGAAKALSAALLLQETLAAEQLSQNIPLGPGRRAEDYYAAARVQVELKQPAAAWELLDLLDQTSRGGAESCDPGVLETVEDEQDLLLEELRALERPASGIRRLQREPVQRSLRSRLQELWRSRRPCSPKLAPESKGEKGPHFRAFALADEVILLQRLPNGSVQTARRTAMERSDLARALEKTAKLMGSQPVGAETSEDVWDATLRPLAEALLPPDLKSLPKTTSFGLYGLLQETPLAALPLLRDDGPKQRLIDFTIPVVRPAAVGTIAEEVEGPPVFVVDPREDLDGGALASFYRQVFPESQILEGPEATREALFQALEAAAWFHVDAHGTADPAFPELSSLLLADRPVTFLELGDLERPLLLANLSGCQTGRWPVTADSGRFGIGGLLASRNAQWVIASRADLDNRMAEELNRAFYQRLAESDSVPHAYGEALRHLGKNYPVSAWAAFLLLSSHSGGANGK